MGMSRDRIRFTLTDSLSNRAKVANAAAKAFNILESEAGRLFDSAARIECRPSQFARFIVFRYNNDVGTNQIKPLNPELLETDIKSITDVSTNPRKD